MSDFLYVSPIGGWGKRWDAEVYRPLCTEQNEEGNFFSQEVIFYSYETNEAIIGNYVPDGNIVITVSEDTELVSESSQFDAWEFVATEEQHQLTIEWIDLGHKYSNMLISLAEGIVNIFEKAEVQDKTLDIYKELIPNVKKSSATFKALMNPHILNRPTYEEHPKLAEVKKFSDYKPESDEPN